VEIECVMKAICDANLGGAQDVGEGRTGMEVLNRTSREGFVTGSWSEVVDKLRRKMRRLTSRGILENVGAFLSLGTLAMGKADKILDASRGGPKLTSCPALGQCGLSRRLIRRADLFQEFEGVNLSRSFMTRLDALMPSQSMIGRPSSSLSASLGSRANSTL
jgi:hypothetical protein